MAVVALLACLLSLGDAAPVALDEDRSVAQLIERLRLESHSVTGTEERQAHDALVRLGAPAVAALAAELDNPDPGIMVAAAAALIDIGAPAVPALAAVMGRGNENARMSAARSLSAMAAKGIDVMEAMPAVLAGVKDPAVGVRISSIRTLDVAAAQTRLEYAQANRALVELVRALADRDTGVQMTAAEALGQFGPAASSAAPALEKLLRAKEDWLREGAQRALAEIRAPLSALVGMLEDNDAARRGRAIFILGLTGPPAREALTALRARAAVETDAALRAAIAEAIGRIESR